MYAQQQQQKTVDNGETANKTTGMLTTMKGNHHHHKKPIKRAGLCVIDPNLERMYIIRRRFPYTQINRSSNENGNGSGNNNHNYQLTQMAAKHCHHCFQTQINCRCCCLYDNNGTTHTPITKKNEKYLQSFQQNFYNDVSIAAAPKQIPIDQTNIVPKQKLSTPTPAPAPPPFIEEIQVPRGRCEKDETLLNCAIREFMEECGIYFKSIHFLTEAYRLQWEDIGYGQWEYKIFFGIASFNSNNIIRVTNHTWANPFRMPNLNTTTTTTTTSLYNNQRKRRRYEPIEPGNPETIPIVEYIGEIQKRLPLYGNNNYSQFLRLLERLLKELKAAAA